MQRDVRETRAAKQDRIEIWLYIANDSISAADKVIEDILAVSRRLGEFPESARSRPDLGPDIHAAPLGSYMIFYRLEPQTVRVLRILHAARDITPDLLSE
jgi:toxin ParE1/3/4